MLDRASSVTRESGAEDEKHGGNQARKMRNTARMATTRWSSMTNPTRTVGSLARTKYASTTSSSNEWFKTSVLTRYLPGCMSGSFAGRSPAYGSTNQSKRATDTQPHSHILGCELTRGEALRALNSISTKRIGMACEIAVCVEWECASLSWPAPDSGRACQGWLWRYAGHRMQGSQSFPSEPSSRSMQFGFRFTQCLAKTRTGTARHVV